MTMTMTIKHLVIRICVCSNFEGLDYTHNHNHLLHDVVLYTRSTGTRSLFAFVFVFTLPFLRFTFSPSIPIDKREDQGEERQKIPKAAVQYYQ